MRSCWAAAAVSVLGVIWSVGGEVDAKESVVEGNAEREMKLYNLYKEIVESGQPAQGSWKAITGRMGAKELEQFAGLTPIEMYRVFAEKLVEEEKAIGKGHLDRKYNEYIADLEVYKGREDRCKLKDMLTCTANVCVKHKADGSQEYNSLKKIAGANGTEATTSPPKNGGDPGEGKSGAGGSVSSVGGALLVALVTAAFSLSA